MDESPDIQTPRPGAPLPQRPPTWPDAGLRYYRYSHFLKERFGVPVRRVSLDAGFTCPNVDGTVARGGCVYCDNRSFTPARRLSGGTLAEQAAPQMAKMDRRYAPAGYLAYFQAATNTYGELSRLKALYDEALRLPRCLGLIISTRPDALPEPVVDLLASYAERLYVGLEIGVQTVHDRTLSWMNRGHDAACYFDAVRRCQGRGLDLATHVILGLPGESHADMMTTAEAVAASGVAGVKIHSLHVVRHSVMAAQWRRGEVPMMSLADYAATAADFLERLPPTMVIHRLMGDAPPDELLAPEWALQKQGVLAAIEGELARRGSRQGRLHKPATSATH